MATASRAAAYSVALVGAIALAGWAFDISAAKSVVPGLATMKANTALCLLAAGLSRVWSEAPSPRRRVAARAGALAVTIVAALSALEYLLDADVGVDQLLFTDAESTLFPGRMAPATAVALVFAGCGLLALSAEPRHSRVAVWCAAPTLAVAWLALVGYVYDISALYTVGAYSSMAVHTAASLVALALSIAAAAPDVGLAKVAAGDTSGSALVRYVLPALPIVALAGGALWLAFERRGWFDPAFTSAIRTLSLTTLGVAAVAVFASVLHHSELSRRRLAERLADRRAEAVLDAAPDPIVVANERGRIVLLNTEAERQFGYSRDELLGQPVDVLLPERAVHQARGVDAAHASGGNAPAGRVDLFARRKDGSEFQAEVGFSPLMTSDGLLVSSAIRDVTLRRQAEEAEARLAAIVESSEAAICSTGTDGTIQTWNHGARQLFGYEPDEIVGRRVSELVPPLRRESECGMVTMAAAGEPVGLRPAELLRRDGTVVEVAVTASPIRNPDGTVAAVSIIARDITQQRLSERRLQASLEEKDTLLREVHHRVKNNLAVVSSLLYLESTQPQQAESVRILQDARLRVLSMATVHETLYQSESFGRLNLADYIATLTADLHTSFGRTAERVRIQIEGAAFVGMQTAVPCALIVNELVTNCLKHAFVGVPAGHVRVRLEQHGLRLHVSVRDDGVGIPATVDVATSASLGLRLVRALTTQLSGRFEIRRLAPGSEATLTFDDIRSS